jgi:succinate dehydrogenase / fumarate reductase cytochrome b subunit
MSQAGPLSGSSLAKRAASSYVDRKDLREGSRPKGPWMNLQILPIESSLGKKYVMAVTGLLLTLFVIAHLLGNSLIFVGRDALNAYAEGLRHLPTLLWLARIGLLVVFILHIAYGLRVTWENQQARPVGYVCEKTVRASWASRHMLLTGLLLLAFVLYHLAHFTFYLVDNPINPATGKAVNYDALEQRGSWPGKIPGSAPRHDTYAMVVFGFRNPWISISYLFFMVVLWLHLWHGASSWLQSLGLNHPRYRFLIDWLGPVVSTLVFLGNCAIVLSVWTGLIPLPSEYLPPGSPQ